MAATYTHTRPHAHTYRHHDETNQNVFKDGQNVYIH